MNLVELKVLKQFCYVEHYSISEEFNWKRRYTYKKLW